MRLHLTQHWHAKHQNIAESNMDQEETLVKLFENLMAGMLAVPINLPFTRFRSSLSSRSRIRDIILEIISERRRNLKNHTRYQDFISIHDETGKASLSDDEIVDNCIFAMLAGHDTTSTLLTFLIKLLAEDSSIYNNILEEQEEIARGKESGEFLTWDVESCHRDIEDESARVFYFRKVLQDFEYEGYLIAKGCVGSIYDTDGRIHICGANEVQFIPVRNATTTV